MKHLLIMILLFPLVAGAWEQSDKKTPDESVFITTSSGELLKAYLWYPEGYFYGNAEQKFNAVVMAHGCAGAHYKDNPDQWTKKYVSGKFKVWGNLLNKQGMIVMLVDSFTTRDAGGDVGGGVCSSTDPLGRPAKIDPVSVRPADIAEAIRYLKTSNALRVDKVGVLGFSNGGTSALVMANHESLVERTGELAELGKEAFSLPFDAEYRADLFVSLYPGCGLNGYSESTNGIFAGHFETYTDTFMFIASNDTVLPENTKEKCRQLRILDAEKNSEAPNMMVKVIKNTDHQFDYTEENEVPVRNTIDRIIALFDSM